MSPLQRAVLVLTAAAAVAAVLYPPWVIQYTDFANNRIITTFCCLLTPPSDVSFSAATVSSGLLVCELIAIIAAGAFLFLASGRR
jgi:hypothetical protein